MEETAFVKQEERELSDACEETISPENSSCDTVEEGLDFQVTTSEGLDLKELTENTQHTDSQELFESNNGSEPDCSSMNADAEKTDESSYQVDEPQGETEEIVNDELVQKDPVMESIDLLREGLNQALLSINKKNIELQSIESKLDTYKRTIEDKLVNMFFIDIISIIDNIKRMAALHREKDDNPGFIPCDTFEFYATDLESILLNNSVEIVQTNIGEKFNPRNQRIIKKIPTEDQSLHGVIASIFSEGYLFGGRVISPAKVAAYFYTKPKGE